MVDELNGLKEENFRRIRSIYIQIPRHEHILHRIDRCRRESILTAEPECLLILGESGTGKSMIIKRYMKEFVRHEAEEHSVVPVLVSTVPAPGSIKYIVTKLLHSLGDSLPERGTTLEQTLRLIKLLKDRRVELIILDEFQHFTEQNNSLRMSSASDWLKTLIVNTKIPIVLAGLPKSIDILRANEQLRIKYFATETLRPFGWEWGGMEIREFRVFLHRLDESLPLPKRSNLDDIDTSYRLYCASNGIISTVMKIVRRAAGLAIDRNFPKLTSHQLSEAYEEEIAYENDNRGNPFTTAINELKTVPHKPSLLGSKAIKERVWRKGHAPGAFKVLRAAK